MLIKSLFMEKEREKSAHGDTNGLKENQKLERDSRKDKKESMRVR